MQCNVNRENTQKFMYLARETIYHILVHLVWKIAQGLYIC